MTELQPHLDQQWRLFGEKAGIKKKVLKKIGKNPSQDSRLAQVLDHWLRNSKKERTWADIIIILRGMNHRQLANRIKSKKIDLEGKRYILLQIYESDQQFTTSITRMELCETHIGMFLFRQSRAQLLN